MKSKNIYEIAFKLLGIIAAWKFVESLVLFGIVFITYSSMPILQKIRFWDLIPVNNVSIYLIGAYALFAFLLLFRTNKLMQWLKLDSEDEVDIPIQKAVFYHILVLVVGFSMFIYSANHIVTKSYSSSDNTTSTTTNQPTTTTTQSQPNTNSINMNLKVTSYSKTTTTSTCTNSSSKSTTTTNTTTTSYNYLSMLLLLLSFLVIFKSNRISKYLTPSEIENI